jgi:hypothetical protein
MGGRPFYIEVRWQGLQIMGDAQWDQVLFHKLDNAFFRIRNRIHLLAAYSGRVVEKQKNGLTLRPCPFTGLFHVFFPQDSSLHKKYLPSFPVISKGSASVSRITQDTEYIMYFAILNRRYLNEKDPRCPYPSRVNGVTFRQLIFQYPVFFRESMK